MKWRAIRGMSGDQVIHEVVVDVGRNILVLGAGFLLVLGLGHLSASVAFIGPWVFLLAAGYLAFRFLLGCLVGLADSVLEGAEGGRMEGSGWILFVTGARILELLVVFLMAFFLFRHSP